MAGTQTTLYLVRHAHSPYVPNKEAERSLSEQGHRSASRVTKILMQRGIDVVISSPYTRAVETVEGTAKTVDTTPIIECGFRERRLAESHVEDFENAIRRVWQNPSFSWEGGESNDEAQQRGVEAVESVLEKWTGKNIAIGTHGNLLALILNYYDSRYDYEFWKELTMPDIYQLKFFNQELTHAKRVWTEQAP